MGKSPIAAVGNQPQYACNVCTNENTEVQNPRCNPTCKNVRYYIISPTHVDASCM